MTISYLICPTFAEADGISARVAAEQGCTGDVTTHWFRVIEHPTDGRSALVVGAANSAKLNVDEQAALVPSLTAEWSAT